jgi:hypothetical protein
MLALHIAHAQVHCQKQHRNEGKLALARFPYNTSTSSFPRKELHHEANLAHVSIHLIVNKTSRTCASPTTTLHCEGNHKHKCISNRYIASWRKVIMC